MGSRKKDYCRFCKTPPTQFLTAPATEGLIFAFHRMFAAGTDRVCQLIRPGRKNSDGVHGQGKTVWNQGPSGKMQFTQRCPPPSQRRRADLSEKPPDHHSSRSGIGPASDCCSSFCRDQVRHRTSPPWPGFRPSALASDGGHIAPESGVHKRTASGSCCTALSRGNTFFRQNSPKS